MLMDAHNIPEAPEPIDENGPKNIMSLSNVFIVFLRYKSFSL